MEKKLFKYYLHETWEVIAKGKNEKEARKAMLSGDFVEQDCTFDGYDFVEEIK